MSKRYREYGTALLMLAGSGVLAAILLSQLLHYRHVRANLKSRLSTKLEVHLQAPAGEEKHYQLPGLEDYAVTVERPLFMENRKPAEAEVAASAPETANVPKLPLTAKLMGVVFAPGQKPLGLFTDAAGKYMRLRSDDPKAIGGWKVVGIEADKAIMEQDGVREELKLVKAKLKKPPLPPKTAAFPRQFPGQFPGQPPSPFGANNPATPPGTPENPAIPPLPVDSGQPIPNEPFNATPVPPEEFPNEQ